MPYAGRQIPASEIAEMLWDLGWRDTDLIDMTATILGESGGWTEAYNDNLDSKGRVTSRDIGLAQINIRARDIGTSRERKLKDPKYNLQQARKLFDTRETLVKRRRFNPWYAFTTGWATFPEWWVFRSAEAAKARNLPREWTPTGRYLHQALIGVTNFYAKKYGITHPDPFVKLPDPPKMPSKPPKGDGPRPVKNKGRGTHGRA